MIVRNFSDGSYLEYDTGQFYDWCVYLTRPGHPRYAPRDFQYFERLKLYASHSSNDAVYDAFVKVYNATGRKVEKSVFDSIDAISRGFGSDALDLSIDFSIIYMGMIAEENKAFAILGKRVKRLGVYQVLKGGMSPNMAANFSRGRKWRELDVLCRSYGF